LLQLVDVVVRHFGGFFPELVAARDTIYSVLQDEEKTFGRTLKKGTERFNKLAEALKASGRTVVSGQEAFEMWDTYGFPVDLTEIEANERGLTVDKQGKGGKHYTNGAPSVTVILCIQSSLAASAA
jgi:alanyl-tRNA synthetase